MTVESNPVIVEQLEKLKSLASKLQESASTVTGETSDDSVAEDGEEEMDQVIVILLVVLGWGYLKLT